jgi:ribosome maturation factor RimP
MNYLARLQEITLDLCKEMNLHLLDVEEKGSKNMPLFLVFADTENGITLGECEKLSRAIQDEIDFSDDFPIKYRLDVSSPGLDKPLVKDFQFTRNIGKDISLKMKNINENKKIVGKLKSIDDKRITLEDKKGHETVFNRDDVVQAKVELQW